MSGKAVNQTVLVDVDGIIAGRAGKRHYPAFVVRWIKSFVHQDFLNGYFRQGKLGIEFAEGALEYLRARVSVSGMENIPAEGRHTFVCNHPLGGIDALAVIALIGRAYDGSIRFSANDFLMNVKQLAEYMIPVNKMGGQAASLIGQIDEAFASEHQIIWFPAGKCSRLIEGKVQDTPWRKTFISKSRQSGRDIVPMWFSGQNSNRFYRLDRLCTKLKIKTNLAMFCLPDELYRGQDKDYNLVVGKPIPIETFTPDKRDAEWAEEVRRRVYSLAE